MEADEALGQSVDIGPDVRMPLLGLGTWLITGREAYQAVRRALDIGYRHIDTATMYGNEDQVGRALAVYERIAGVRVFAQLHPRHIFQIH